MQLVLIMGAYYPIIRNHGILFRYHDTDDFDHEHETYRQNVFRVEYKNNDV